MVMLWSFCTRSPFVLQSTFCKLLDAVSQVAMLFQLEIIFAFMNHDIDGLAPAIFNLGLIGVGMNQTGP
uniref:Uncharacterized protein n=1 Tax=Arundo donax TaxID=35708 RepID=A0A0A9GU61_ARUDO